MVSSPPKDDTTKPPQVDTSVQETVEAPTMKTPTTATDNSTAASTNAVTEQQEDSFREDYMPLLQYSKWNAGVSFGESRCTSTAMAQVLLRPTASSGTQSAAVAGTEDADAEDDTAARTDLWKEPHYVVARGFENGTISLSTASGLPVKVDHPFVIRDNPSYIRATSAVDVSLDATGTFLAAIDEKGICSIWELKYEPYVQRRNDREQRSTTGETGTVVSAASTQNTGMFSNFMTKLTGLPASPEEEEEEVSTHSATEDPSTITSQATARIPCLKADVVSATRINYPTHWKPPTALCLDPAHRRKSTFVAGFQDGRLLLTKRGGLFQRRSDTILYQGGGESKDYRGIECVTWRGNLVAWADTSGIKLLDIDTLTRIAHIDRPSGAKVALYPTIPHLRPCLIFETSSDLIVAWGDCLMNMSIQETPVQGEGTAVTTRRSVQCSMAWELDCVAAGVAPLDQDNIVVLGFIPPTELDSDDEGNANAPAGRQESNELELQIISRIDGTIQHADILPTCHAMTWLQSSFSLPRMDDASEWNEWKAWTGRSFDDGFDLAILTGAESPPVGSGGTRLPSLTPRNEFVDPHKEWSLKSVQFGDEASLEGDENDAESVDSDDYGFAFRPLHLVDDTNLNAPPPRMILVSDKDAISVSVSTVDDAVEHALVTQNRPALALKRALQHRRQLRRYRIPFLVKQFLEALLFMSEECSDRPLSLRRMKLAIEAMPVLLGAQSDLWMQWTNELKEIPGALFILRRHLPVRDPVLPSILYEQVLLSMFEEFESLSASSEENNNGATTLVQEAGRHILEGLLAWGPTKGLKEYIKLFQLDRKKGDKNVQESLKEVEIALQRRYLQTSADYLTFPAKRNGFDRIEGHSSTKYDANDSADSLYSLDKLQQWLQPRLSGIDTEQDSNGQETDLSQTSQLPGCVFLDAAARLHVLRGEYESALKLYLGIGLLHSTPTMSKLESVALQFNHSGFASAMNPPILVGGMSYAFVLGLVENHHLHRLLLGTSISFLGDSTVTEKRSPLFALFRLVGLKRAGQFLMAHCVAPEVPTHKGPGFYSDESPEMQRRESLPMDLIAEQLKSSPPLLYWYLCLVLAKKPELYVKFPNNALPPDPVTELHRRHFDLYLQYSVEEKDSAKFLAELDTYRVESASTRLLSFLKATLPLGAIPPVDARRKLEVIRSQEVAKGGDADEDSDNDDENDPKSISPSFALELAHIVENYSNHGEDEAMFILDLYLQGAKSIMLAVAFTQRQRYHASVLWDRLIEHCLSSAEGENPDEGLLFGSLLEAAALAGADLARLVSRIPPGLVVEGLRPRLVAAVADYRLMVDIHQAASAASAEEKILLIREVAHRSRRGARFIFSKVGQKDIFPSHSTPESKPDESANDDHTRFLPKDLRPKKRSGRHCRSLSLPIR